MKTIHASAPDPSNQVEVALELDLLHLPGSVGALTKPGITGEKQVVWALKDAAHRLDTDGRLTSPGAKAGPPLARHARTFIRPGTPSVAGTPVTCNDQVQLSRVFRDYDWQSHCRGCDR
jgi:hypothetical protein